MFFLLAIRESEDNLYSVLYFLFKLFLYGHLHYCHHLYIIFIYLKLVVRHNDFFSHWNSITSEWLYLFLFIIIVPIWILSTAFILFIFFAHRQCNSFLHLLVSTSPADIWLITFSFHLFFLVFFYSFGWIPFLMIVVVIKQLLITIRKFALNWKNLESALFYWDKKSRKVEIRYNFRKAHA